MKTKLNRGAITLLLACAAVTANADLAVTRTTVNLRAGEPIKFICVGDLDGNGTQDFVVDRQGNPQKIEAYTSTGTFLWEVNFGPNSADQDGIEPGSAAVNVGHYDGVAVADINGDGRAEVMIKYADGVRFGNGTTYTNSNDNYQRIGVLTGTTGALLASAPLPAEFASDGPLACWFGAGSQGVFVMSENRKVDNSWNRAVTKYTLSGSTFTERWKWTNAGASGCSMAHQMRVCDVTGDGSDEVCHIAFALGGNTGTLMYSHTDVTHGDRWHIAKMSPSLANLQLYGVQQNAADLLYDFLYDAKTGAFRWKRFGSTSTDVGRGNVGDIDTRAAGYECWAFAGVYNAVTHSLTSSTEPYPNLRIWWDGDRLSENLNNQNVEKWNQDTGGLARQFTGWSQGGGVGSGALPIFYGDIQGDWREEIILRNTASSQLFIYQTGIANSSTVSRPFSDRYYKNGLSIHGYLQSHHTSYYIGN